MSKGSMQSDIQEGGSPLPPPYLLALLDVPGADVNDAHRGPHRLPGYHHPVQNPVHRHVDIIAVRNKTVKL